NAPDARSHGLISRWREISARRRRALREALVGLGALAGDVVKHADDDARADQNRNADRNGVQRRPAEELQLIQRESEASDQHGPKAQRQAPFRGAEAVNSD